MLHTNHTIALVVDIQERLIPAMNHAEQFIDACAKMVEGLNILGIPVALTEQYPKGLGATVDKIRSQFNPNSPIFEKTLFSAYTEEVKHWIEQHSSVKSIILIGCETHVCILQTALDLKAAGYEVYLAQECLASRTETNRQNGMAQMQQNGAIISNIESILFMLLKDAKHQNFKAISKLIL